jgi:hypothetical protein
MHYVVHLDKPYHAPRLDQTLLQLITDGYAHWPAAATAVTQESDGELLWWMAPVAEIQEARAHANPEMGLMPLLGFARLVCADYYTPDDDDTSFTASDWETAVVSRDEFEQARSNAVATYSAPCIKNGYN